MSYGYWPKEEKRMIRRSWYALRISYKIPLMLLWLSGYIVISGVCLMAMSIVFGVTQNRLMMPLNLNFLNILWMIPWYGLTFGECEKHVLRGRRIWFRRFAQAMVVAFLLIALTGLAGFDPLSRTAELVTSTMISLAYWPTAWIFWTQWFGRYVIGDWRVIN